MYDQIHSEPLWAEIDLAALRHNFRFVTAHLNHGVGVMAVVKGNAYGHGAVPVARELLREGAAAFGVARVAEAVALRRSGIGVPILVFSPTPPEEALLLAQYNIMQTVHSDEYADALNNTLWAVSRQKRVAVHVKIDTGMGRLGYLATGSSDHAPLDAILEGYASRSCLDLQGVYTHFAASDALDLTAARKQLDAFQQSLDRIPADIRRRLCIHAANSAAVLRMPDAHFDMVRPGIALYGLPPSESMKDLAQVLHPAMSIRARLSSVKQVPAGFTVSYDHTYITDKPTVIAAVPVGYADGYSRLLSSRGSMLVHGMRAPVAGTICMDQTMLDVGHIQDVHEGDEVTVIGSQGDECITAGEHARLTSTITYEVVARILARVPRVYLDNEPESKRQELFDKIP